jgi:hypothetical protein
MFLFLSMKKLRVRGDEMITKTTKLEGGRVTACLGVLCLCQFMVAFLIAS